MKWTGLYFKIICVVMKCLIFKILSVTVWCCVKKLNLWWILWGILKFSSLIKSLYNASCIQNRSKKLGTTITICIWNLYNNLKQLNFDLAIILRLDKKGKQFLWLMCWWNKVLNSWYKSPPIMFYFKIQEENNKNIYINSY